MNLDFSKGLLPVIVRDSRSGAVLTLAWMNEEALERTLETGQTWFWSRSRNELWHKGATSGNTQRVVHVAADCDSDALLLTIEPSGPACHRGTDSCFDGVPAATLDLDRLMGVLRSRFAERPDGSYSAYLFNSGRDKILKKIGEEATEVVIAGKGGTKDRLASEVADLIFHLSALLVDADMDWSDVGRELAGRAR